jgi:23S rRNA U2552 (ribose-2'-O)-methylase RlmE/FtsJ
LNNGGSFLFKIFQSPQADQFIKQQGSFFQRQLRLKPKASRRESQEIFVLGMNFKGAESSNIKSENSKT